jgi:hypothetical protein
MRPKLIACLQSGRSAGGRKLIDPFRSAAVFGLAFQAGTRQGPKIDELRALLGTGLLRPGTMRWPAAFCASVGSASAALRARETTTARPAAPQLGRPPAAIVRRSPGLAIIWAQRKDGFVDSDRNIAPLLLIRSA